jgi:phage/plasmid-like protein (TIGR03299 family)
MSANVETMFYVREKPWHGLGTLVAEAPSSGEALIYAGLNWQVEQKDVYTEDGSLISGYKVNTRSSDNAALGIVSDRYKVVQNEDAFQFTDDLLGVTYETAGSLQGGRKVWMLARMPHRYIIAGDEITPYLVVMNSHDGSSGIKVAMTPIRVVCQNTLNLALGNAKRIWTTKHTENVMSRVYEARETLALAETYMGELGRGIDVLSKIKLTDKKVMEFMEEFFPVNLDMPEAQRKNNLRLLADMKCRYWDAPDLAHVGKTAIASSMPSAISPPMLTPFARPRTTTKTCSCVPWRATP